MSFATQCLSHNPTVFGCAAIYAVTHAVIAACEAMTVSA